MSLQWFRVDNDVTSHPKTFALAELLGDPNAGWYVICLWSWTMRYAARGILPRGAETALEASCGWRGERGALIAALIKSGWLTRTEEVDESGEAISTLEVHDWWERQGAAVAKAEKDAERKRQRRLLARGRAVEGAPRAQRRRHDGAETARAGSADAAGTRRDETRRDVLPLPSEEERAPAKQVSLAIAPAAPPSPPRAAPAPKAEKPPADARHQPLVEALVAAGAHFEARHARDVKRLLALGTQATGHDEASAEVLTRWRRALTRTGYPTVRSLSELADHWGHFGEQREPGAPSDWSGPPGMREVVF